MSKMSSQLLIAALLGAGVAQTHAANVTFTGFFNGSEAVTYSLSGTNATRSGAASAGGFATVLDGGPSFETYCVDLYQFIGFGTTYNDYSGPTLAHSFNNSAASADLSRLFATAGPRIDAQHEAAFQLAVWEIAYEKTGSAYDLGSGDASFTGASGTLALASGWLSSLALHGPGPGIAVLESPGQQDMVYAPVPEPETYALMLAGLAAIGAAARRRKGHARDR
jgi:hypothetical protein